MTEDYVIGLLWTTASVLEGYVVVRSVDTGIIEIIAGMAGRNVISICGRSAVKIPIRHPIAERLFALGWTGRMDKERGLPDGEIDMLDWIKGYCRVRAHCRMWRGHMRIRIYGSLNIVSGLSSLLSQLVQVGEKKPQLCKRREGGDTWGLYYQSASECAKLAKWIVID